MPGPFSDDADHLLDLLQWNTLKTFCLMSSEVVCERLEKGGAFIVRIAVVKS